MLHLLMLFNWKFYSIWFYFAMLFIDLSFLEDNAEVLAACTAAQKSGGITEAALGCLWSVSLLLSMKPFYSFLLIFFFFFL